MYVNKLTNELNQAILEGAGLTSSQFQLDTGSVIVPFTWFRKGFKRGQALKMINQAELGSIYMAENGQIRSENRTNWNSHTNVWNFTKEHILERNSMNEDTVVNVVEVFSKARQVQAKQSLWASDGNVRFSDGTESLPAGGTKSVFIDFSDDDGALPVTSVDDPDPIASFTTSFYSANSMPDSTGDEISSDVDLDSLDLFSTAAKLTFTNTGAQEAFITQLEVFGTPAKVVNDIYERVEDATSVGARDGFEEHPLSPPIENDLIQDAIAARSIGQIIIGDRAEDDDQQVWIVKAVPQLQVGDVVNYTDENTNENYFVTRINDIVNNSGYRQVLHVTKRTINSYFRIGISTIGGSDVLGP